ncbi:MAG: class I SAM-dependent methyltransferase [Pseudobdellovibrio sp.]
MSQIQDVTDTSFWVAYYRALETERPDALFRDRFASLLVGERGKKISDSMADISRYTQWSVVSRTVIIDRFIEQLIAEGVDAVINLGTGLDTRPYRMNLPASLKWVEADYPKIIAHKSQILKSEAPNCQLTRFEVDLAQAQERKNFLQNVVPDAKKVLIITEGVIPYLTPQQVSDLANDLLSQPRFCYWITEYFHHRVYRYLKNTVRDLKMKNAPFQFYPDDWYGFFRNLGWVEKETRFNSEIAFEFKRRPPMPKMAQVIFFFLPKKIRQEAMQMTGYVIFKRA